MNKSFCFTLFCLLAMNLHAFNLRKSGGDISGSVIHSIFQDSQGLVWVGTNTGVSRFDGKESRPAAGLIGVNKISGTVTGEIIAETLYGLKIYNPGNDSISDYSMFNNTSFVTSDSKGSIFVIQGNGFVYYKTARLSEFDNIIVPDLLSSDIRFFKVSDNNLCIVSGSGVVRIFEIVYIGDIIRLNEIESIKTDSNILHFFECENQFYFLDDEYRLSEFASGKTMFIMDLKNALQDKGAITAGVVFDNDIYFGTESGLYRINNYNAVKISIKKGINCLLRDKFQNLVWIGTSGDGLYTLSHDRYSITSNLLSDFSPAVSKAITAIYLDDNQTLWLGTEGNGIITVPGFNVEDEIIETRLFTAEKGLPGNLVRSLQKSNYGIWIGCESGLAFYSYKHKNIKKITDELTNIHSVFEQDSLLWITCYEKGITKASLAFKDDFPILSDMQLFSINNRDEASNRFTAINFENNRVLFINKSLGVFEIIDNRLNVLFEKPNSINQIKAIENSTYIISSDFGIYNLTDNKVHQLNTIISKDIISGQGLWNDYWFSSDNGITLYNINSHTFRHFDAENGLTVTEYFDGASFKDEQNSVLFFGGINGFATIRYNFYDEAMDYMPMLFLEKLNLFGIQQNIKDFEKAGKLVFKSNENVFSITYNAPDYINGNNYNYYYKIGKGQWVDNGNSGTVSFTNMRVGNHELQIKYYNKMLYKESYSQKLTITILPPWYRSVYAYGVYSLMFFLGLCCAFLLVSKRRQNRREEEQKKAEQLRKEEIYEAKLDFFTDIAHEFCTPLTLIYGPCNRILKQENVTPSVLRYVNVINNNAKRMNSLISDLMDFKQIESGHKQPDIRRLNISSVADSVIDFFKIDASGVTIDIEKHYYAGIYWNTDEKFLTTILSNLVSNAVKYSKGIGLKVDISTESDYLTIKVSNCGKGISKEDIPNIFNRYTVLNNLDEHGAWRQNGLGLALTSGMVNLLNGVIDVESVPYETTTFTIRLPKILVSESPEKPISENPDKPVTENHNVYELDSPQKIKIKRPKNQNTHSGEQSITNIAPATRYIFKEDRQTTTVIDDDPEMLWFICDLLNDEYNVMPINEPASALEILSVSKTDIIISDLNMSEITGIELTKSIKSNKGTSHIPLIILSATHESEKQMEVIDAGAEIYITKPFDVDYLKSIIRRLLGRKEDLKDYFASPLSAYELNMGKLQHIEHRKFMKKIYAIINQNIENESLSPDFIAVELGLSTRSLYRKIKEVSDISLLEIMREGKLAVAENLLMKSKFTIDEIVFKSGFSNRANFYRSFKGKYGCAPTEFMKKNSAFYASTIKTL